MNHNTVNSRQALWTEFFKISPQAQAVSRFLLFPRSHQAHPQAHLPDMLAFSKLMLVAVEANYLRQAASRRPITHAASWSHVRRRFFVLADFAANAQGKASSPCITRAVGGSAPDQQALFHIERYINDRLGGGTSRSSPSTQCAVRRRTGKLDVSGARQVGR